MLKNLRPGRIYIATGYTDLRKGSDGLAKLIQEQLHLDAGKCSCLLYGGTNELMRYGLPLTTKVHLILQLSWRKMN